jgi:hypothetical protein
MGPALNHAGYVVIKSLPDDDRRLGRMSRTDAGPFCVKTGRLETGRSAIYEKPFDFGLILW